MRAYTVVVHILNEDIKAIVQVTADNTNVAIHEAFKRLYKSWTYDLCSPEAQDVFDPSSGYSAVVFGGHSPILCSDEYNVYELSVLERLAAIEEET